MALESKHAMTTRARAKPRYDEDGTPIRPTYMFRRTPLNPSDETQVTGLYLYALYPEAFGGWLSLTKSAFKDDKMVAIRKSFAAEDLLEDTLNVLLQMEKLETDYMFVTEERHVFKRPAYWGLPTIPYAAARD